LPDDVRHIFTEHIRHWDVSHRARGSYPKSAIEVKAF
jgi:hypothetical protein